MLSRKKDLHQKMAVYVENNPEEIYVDYRDELSSAQVDKVLEGRADTVRFEIEESVHAGREEYEFYWERMCQELGCSMDEVNEWLQTDGFYPSDSLSDSDWRKILSNTTVNIVGIVDDAEWNFNNWAYGLPVSYSDVKESLKIMGINPLEFRKLMSGGSETSGAGRLKGYFPDMPKREPKVNIKDLWDNMIVLYDGVLHFCFGDLEEVAEVVSGDTKNITVKKGTNIVFYDRFNGAGITETTLTEDLKIPRKKVDFRNDTDNKYGVQSCYGFVQGYWNEGGVRNG